MRCDEVEGLIPDCLVDGTDLGEAFRSHLRHCEACRLRFEPLVTLGRLAADVPWQELPVGFDARFWQRLTEYGPYPGANGGVVPLRLLFAVGSRGFSWVLFPIPSVALAVAILSSINASAGPLIDLSARDLAGVLLVMMLVWLVPAAVRLQRVTRECRS